MVRFLSSLLVGLACLGIAVPVIAQDRAELPNAERPAKTEKTPPQKEESIQNDQVDLDKFFKQGEENAKASSCDKPSKPADPMA